MYNASIKSNISKSIDGPKKTNKQTERQASKQVNILINDSTFKINKPLFILCAAAMPAHTHMQYSELEISSDNRRGEREKFDIVINLCVIQNSLRFRLIENHKKN